ncbi:hypothetical protein F941_01924 [Acinetobacter bouvetii DSM 14964 = CIP 107468]|uniref:Uncharacterized protein n=1 Tax=Acinetobacter bouvetii DSM 14964 = CIP 107468 TaxID=1120925 RepID=N9DPA9_9GAMM|nr:hypothetical protein [Acinetobacter bouvetii]ENV82530.1 hypothetical protein F941_01924 [Acinetobacter bouvetii DSM 14964 = CIP 107468]BCU64471.1 hypothetical protein ACBO_12620 [Acinetobacter bouvetii]
MKKLIFTLLGLGIAVQAVQAASAEQYARDVEKISSQYSVDMKLFLRSLDAKTSQFSAQQQQQFCGIVKKYVDDLYQTTDQNRAYLPPSAQSMTKQTVIDKVIVSPEMQLLKKYNIQCDLK